MSSSSSSSSSSACSEPRCGSPACVRCCDHLPLCALHVAAGKHGQHPQSWTVTDKALFTKTTPSVNALRQKLVAEIERELEAEEKRLTQLRQLPLLRGQKEVSSSAAMQQASQSQQPQQPQRAKPSLPTFAEIRARAMENAKREKAAAAAAAAATEKGLGDKRKRTKVTAGILLHDDGRGNDEEEEKEEEEEEEEEGSGGDNVDADAFTRRKSHSEFLFAVGATAPAAAVGVTSADHAAEAGEPAAKRRRMADGGEEEATGAEGQEDAGGHEATSSSSASSSSSSFSALPTGIDDKLREGIRKILLNALKDGLAADVATTSLNSSGGAAGSSSSSRLRALLSSAASPSSQLSAAAASAGDRSSIKGRLADLAVDAFLADKADQEASNLPAFIASAGTSSGTGRATLVGGSGGGSGSALELFASGIEAGIFLKAGAATTSAGAFYRERARAIAAALREKDNSRLRLSLVDGGLAPPQVASIPLEQLASKQVKQADSFTKEQRLLEATAVDAGGGTASWMPAQKGVKCSSCGAVATGEEVEGKETIQYCPARSTVDMRKAETWGGASAEDMLYRFRCKACGVNWFSETMY